MPAWRGEAGRALWPLLLVGVARESHRVANTPDHHEETCGAAGPLPWTVSAEGASVSPEA